MSDNQAVPYAWPLTVLALSLSGVTAISVFLAIHALIDDRLLASLFAGAAVLLDLFKYAAWPVSLHMLSVGRQALAVLLIACALVLAGVSGWATYDRLMSSIIASHAQHDAIQKQRITDLETARKLDFERLERIEEEARSAQVQGAVMRERGMVTKALMLETTAQRRLDAQRGQVRERLDASSSELTELRSRPAKAASLPRQLAILLCLGFAAALEIVPALILSAVRHSRHTFLDEKRQQPTPETASETPETLETPAQMSETAAGDQLLGDDAELLNALLHRAASASPGDKVPIKEWAREARIGNVRAARIFNAAVTRAAIRKTEAGYVFA